METRRRHRMKRSAILIQKIQEIEKLLEEIKLDLQEILGDEEQVKKEDNNQTREETEVPSLGGFYRGDRVKFRPTPTTRGGYGIVKDWTAGVDPFLKIERENSSGNRIVLRKPHKVSYCTPINK